MQQNETRLGLFINATDFTSHRAGDVIFERGSEGQVMFVVKEGTVALRIGDRTLESLGAGGMFGEMALIDSERRSATAIAATDCQIVAIDEKRFRFLIQQTPFFALEVMRVMACRLRAMNQRQDS